MDGSYNQPVHFHRYMGPASANTTLRASTVSSVRISIMTCPGIQLRMATVTPVGVSEALAPYPQNAAT